MIAFRPLAWALAVFTIVAANDAARAQSTVSLYEDHQVKLGSAASFHVSGMHPSHNHTVKWFVRQNSGGCVSAWFAGAVDQTIVSQYFTIPGTFELSCVVTYLDAPGTGGVPIPAPPPESPVCTYTVPTFDDTTILSGLDTDTAYNSQFTVPTNEDLNGATGCWLFFKLWAGGQAVGPYLSATVQERITNKVVDGVAQDDSDWAPPGPDVRFYLGQVSGDAVIADFKHFTVVPPNPAVGDHFTYTQENRVKWTDWCGTVQTKSVGTNNLKFRTTGPNTWQTKRQ